MPRGGSNAVPLRVHEMRGTLRRDRHSQESGLPACRVPRPPPGLSDAAQETWRQLAREVQALRTYTSATRTAFELLVMVVTEARTAGPNMPATARVRLLQVAAGMLASFGLTAATSGRVARGAPPSAPDELDEFDS